VPTREAIIREAREWLDITKYRHQAALKGVACDCIGLIAGVGFYVGIKEAPAFLSDKRFRAYGPEPMAGLLLEACDKYLDPVKLGQEQLGDILVMRFARAPMHFGLLSARNPDYVIHAYAQARKVVENRIDEVWRSRIMACYSYRGL
jgi:NlpC/P60 family putative phage cell wall peptidase